MKPLLLARHISYGPAQRPRLSDVDLQLHAGDRLALLGINGAGKSTLMQVLAGVLPARSGEVRILGQRLDQAAPAIRRQIGFLPQRVPAYPELSVTENLVWAGQLRGLRGPALQQAIDTVLQQVQLGAFAGRLAASLSAGMAQRLGLAQAVLHRPQILILDEPTAGLDPLQAEQMRELLGELTEDASLVLATHLLDDVQGLCDRVILLDGGRKVAEHLVTPETDLLAHFRAHAATAATP
ncbi:MAG: ABC transporter ATP-binding protein [Chromatiaceae bacterium]|nr:ABC transporter ATP-binding protein [Chromatiaceae bacterium]